jgi:hypothetical protein
MGYTKAASPKLKTAHLYANIRFFNARCLDLTLTIETLKDWNLIDDVKDTKVGFNHL